MCIEYDCCSLFLLLITIKDEVNQNSLIISKGSLISKSELTLVPNLYAEQKVWISLQCITNPNFLLREELAPFIGNGTKVKIPSEI